MAVFYISIFDQFDIECYLSMQYDEANRCLQEDHYNDHNYHHRQKIDYQSLHSVIIKRENKPGGSIILGAAPRSPELIQKLHQIRPRNS